jgi:hypothetical protein
VSAASCQHLLLCDHVQLQQQHHLPPFAALSLLLATASCSRHAAQARAISIVMLKIFAIFVEEITRRRYASDNLQEQQ